MPDHFNNTGFAESMSLTVSQKKKIDQVAGGLMMAVLKVLSHILGAILRRKHDLQPKKELFFLKLLGGGSLIIAAPTLIGLKKKFPDLKLGIVTTKSVKPFAEFLGVFDTILVVNDGNLLGLLISSGKAIIRLFRVDTIIDLEVYSKLSSAFCLLTCARNRIGFYTETTFWRAGIVTHLLFFNRSSGVYLFYDQLADLLGATPASVSECIQFLQLEKTSLPEVNGQVRLGIGHGCSNLCVERMLTIEQWDQVISAFIANHQSLTTSVNFFGVQGEHSFAEDVISRLAPRFPNVSFKNLSGQLSLDQTVSEMRKLSHFHAIDSSLLHFARLVGLEVTSYWGPTSPTTLLRPIESLKERAYYGKVACSPCVHVADSPPCNGNNICMKAHTPGEHVESNPRWLMET